MTFDVKLCKDILEAYSRLDPQQVALVETFFSNYGVGNTSQVIDRPYERHLQYFNLLRCLKENDGEKYLIMHKGTPFYFLGWTALDMGNYERGVYFMDAATSEDLRGSPSNGLDAPAGSYLQLNQDKVQVASRAFRQLVDVYEQQILRFNELPLNTNNSKKLSVESLRTRFFRPLLSSINSRSIVTSMHAFMLEYKDISESLLLTQI